MPCTPRADTAHYRPVPTTTRTLREAMSLTPFQKRKLARMFDVMDVNGDGLVDRADFTRRVQALAELRGWAEDSDEYRRHLEDALEEWQAVHESADVDADGHVSRDEYLRYADVYLDDRDAVRAWARGDAQLVFDAMDVDGDGRITVQEYRTYLEVCGVDASAADTFFAHADLNEDGRVTRAEMAHAFEEFLISDDPASGGNFLFGPLTG